MIYSIVMIHSILVIYQHQQDDSAHLHTLIGVLLNQSEAKVFNSTHFINHYFSEEPINFADDYMSVEEESIVFYLIHSSMRYH